jgi:hypothetical protein
MFGFHEVRENPERSLFDAGYRVLRNETTSNQTIVNEPEHTLEENLTKCNEIINIAMSIPVEENGIVELRKEIDSHRVAAGLPKLTTFDIGNIIKAFFDYMLRGVEPENFKNDMFAKYTAVTAEDDDSIENMSDIMDVDDKDEFDTLVRILRKHKDDRNTTRRKERLMTLIRFYYTEMIDEEIEDLIEKL